MTEEITKEEIKKIIDKSLEANAHFFDTMAFRDGDLTKEQFLEKVKKWKRGSFLYPILRDMLGDKK